ncbi:MAG: hypothetical protein JO230_12890 [Xanthobacteraceae bacterium]|nr:hypothetical protein [Xanthobacteraceae bacterium]
MLSVLIQAMTNSHRMRYLSAGQCDPRDVEATLRYLVPFLAVGIESDKSGEKM